MAGMFTKQVFSDTILKTSDKTNVCVLQKKEWTADNEIESKPKKMVVGRREGNSSDPNDGEAKIQN